MECGAAPHPPGEKCENQRFGGVLVLPGMTNTQSLMVLMLPEDKTQ